jgi:hypothetical protein
MNQKQGLMMMAVATMLGSTTASADYLLQNRASGLCATTGPYNGNVIVQDYCNGARADQRFNITGYVASTNSYRLKNGGDRCLSIGYASTDAGMHSVIWPCVYDTANSTHSNQLHQLVSLAGGYFKIAPTHQIFYGRDYAIDIAHPYQGHALTQMPWTGAVSQQWSLVYVQ